MKRFVIIAIALIFANTICIAQEKRYEYLVVSFGKVYFSDLSDDIYAANKSKMISYSSQGINNYSEAIDLQIKLDILGLKGWELVSTIGAIGGDQEYIFKRSLSEKQKKKTISLNKKL